MHILMRKFKLDLKFTEGYLLLWFIIFIVNKLT